MHDEVVDKRRVPLWLGILVPIVLVAVALYAFAGRDGGGDGDGGATRAGSTTSSASLPAGGGEPTCEDGTRGPRAYILCTAGDADDQGLVVALHGRGSSAQEMQAGTELEHAAAAEGLAVVFVESLDGGWGDDTFTGPTRPAGDEDVVFLDELIGSLRADSRIHDDQPVGVVGFSNGASMALRYATERPDDVRAIVAVAGQLPRDPSIRPTQPVPLLAVYGTADPVRGYDTGIPDDPARQPGDPTPTLPTPDTVAAFVDTLDSPTPEGPAEADPNRSDGTSLRTERWIGADGTIVMLRSIVAGGHTWPSAHTTPTGTEQFGPVSQDLDASAEATTFILTPAALLLDG
jgi:polyhydroxybutyrate depolymerase